MNSRKYHQARRQKEESRKARQQQKLERRLGRAATPAGTAAAQPLPVDSMRPMDPAAESSS